MRDDLSFEPIRVADIDFHVRKSIEQCPAGLMLRELVQNAIEAEPREEENATRRIELRSENADEVAKMSIYNTGRGMTPEKLVAATDLASSIRKPMGLDGRQNRGEGAKVASLPWNACGMIFRSCHDGIASELVLRRIGDRYVRERRLAEFDDGEEGYTVWWDITDEMAATGYDVTQDWTEVVLLGNSIKQDTVRYPYGPEIGRGEKRTVLTEITSRYYDFPPGVQMYASDEYHGRKGMMELRPMARAFARHEHETTENGRLRVRRSRVRIDEGIEIEYVHLPLLSGGNNAIGRYELAGDATRISLVWRNEMYDAQIGRDWQKVAAGYGLPYVHREMAIFVHLPESYPVREDAYRLRLAWMDTGEEVQVEDFQAEIRAHLPEWAKELVEHALAPRQATDMSAVKAELQDRLRRARIQRLEPAHTGTVDASSGHEGRGRPIRSRPPELHVLDRDAPKHNSRDAEPSKPHSGSHNKVRAKRNVSSAPDIIWLDQPDAVAAESLEDRAGKYVPATNTLFLNALHPSVAGKAKALEEHYAMQLDLEQVRSQIVDQVRVDMALHVGSAVVYGLAKEGVRTWSTDDVERALSPEALTVVADNAEGLLPEIRRKLSARDSFRAAKVV